MTVFNIFPVIRAFSFLFLLCVFVSCPSLAQPSPSPQFELTEIPQFGRFYSNNFFKGRVLNVDPAQYGNLSVGLVVHITGIGHYSKPACDLLSVPLDSQGRFDIIAVTGGVDHLADRLILFLINKETRLPCILGGDNIASYEQNALARLEIVRSPDYTAIDFSQIRFLVRDQYYKTEPGQIIFSQSNVSKDSSGRLLLRTGRDKDGNRTGAEIVSQNTFGYGRYTVDISTSAESLPASTVLGVYLWGYRPQNNHGEIDGIELSRFGNASGTNSGKGIQPPTAATYRYFNLPPGCSRHEFVWLPNSIRFLSYDCGGKLVDEFVYNGSVPVQDQNLRLNLWSLRSSSDADASVTISSIRYNPEPPSSVIFVSSASYLNTNGLASGSIVTGYSAGTALATTTAAANTINQTILGGTTVSVKDKIGTVKNAVLHFVSPGQVNFVLPDGLAFGDAEVTVRNSSGSTSVGIIQISRISPSVFCADGSGSGFPAAVYLVGLSDGSYIYEPFVRYDETAKLFVAVPVKYDTRPRYLILFGSGIRNKFTEVQARIGSIIVPASYAGSQGALPGVDQINLDLLRFFGLKGEQELTFFCDGQITNKVKIPFE